MCNSKHLLSKKVIMVMKGTEEIVKERKEKKMSFTTQLTLLKAPYSSKIGIFIIQERFYLKAWFFPHEYGLGEEHTCP